MRAQRRLRLMLVYLVVVPLAAVILFPVLVMLSTAVKPRTEVFAFPPTWLPSTIRWANFPEMWREANFGRALLNSLWIGLASTGLALAVATPAAYALARLRFAGRSLYLYLILVTQMFSPIVIVISLFKQMSYYNLLNTYTSLIVTYAAFSLAFCIWLLSSYFKTIPRELEEAAWLDGCTRWQAMARVFLPLAAPGFVATALFAFILAWNEFVLALTFLSTPEKRPLTVAVYNLVGGRYYIDWHYAMGATFLASLPIVVLFLLLERHLVKGLTAGAIK